MHSLDNYFVSLKLSKTMTVINPQQHICDSLLAWSSLMAHGALPVT